MRNWRIATKVIVGWTLFMGVLTGLAVLSPGYPGVLASFWAIVTLPLALVWYVSRPGVTRVQVGLAVAAALVILWVMTMIRIAEPM